MLECRGAPAIGQHAEWLPAELPCWPAKLSRPRRQRLGRRTTGVRRHVQVPPAALVAHEDQGAAGRPVQCCHADFGSAGHLRMSMHQFARPAIVAACVANADQRAVSSYSLERSLTDVDAAGHLHQSQPLLLSASVRVPTFLQLFQVLLLPLFDNLRLLAHLFHQLVFFIFYSLPLPQPLLT